jgi:hypothetical protein
VKVTVGARTTAVTGGEVETEDGDGAYGDVNV